MAETSRLSNFLEWRPFRFEFCFLGLRFSYHTGPSHDPERFDG